MATRRKNRGFSLVELMVVICIFAIVATIATPMMMRWIPQKRLKSAAADIASAMMQAKSEAIRRGERVTLAFNYQNGSVPRLEEPQLFVMFTDNGLGPMDADGEREACTGCVERNAACENGEEILMVSGPVPHLVGFTANTFNDNALAFNERGLPVDAKNGNLLNKAGNEDRKVRLCVNDATCRDISVSPTGGIKTLISKDN